MTVIDARKVKAVVTQSRPSKEVKDGVVLQVPRSKNAGPSTYYCKTGFLDSILRAPEKESVLPAAMRSSCANPSNSTNSRITSTTKTLRRLRWILRILHEPKYLLPLEFWRRSIIKSCGICLVSAVSLYNPFIVLVPMSCCISCIRFSIIGNFLGVGSE